MPGGGFVRRVQVTGGGSFVVTLPKEWVRRVGLAAGGEVVVEYGPDGSLVLRPLGGGRRGGLLSVRVEARGAGGEDLLRWVVSYYIAGVDVVEIVGAPDAVLRELVGLVSSRLMGVEVVEEASGRVVLQVVVDPASMSLDRSFGRLARTVGYMLDDLARGIESGDRGLLESIPGRDDVVDKLFIFVWRQVFLVLSGRRLARELGARSLGDAVVAMTAAKHLERIGDHASSIAQAVAGGAVAQSCLAGLAGVAGEVAGLFSRVTRVFANPERGSVESAMSRCLELRRHVDGLARGCGSGGPGLYKVLHGVRRVVDYMVDLVELSMNRLALWELEGRLGGGEGG